MAPSNCSYQIGPFVVGTSQYYVRQYVFPFVFAFGIFGNVLNLIVLKKLKKTKSNLFLLLIAVADLCFFVPCFVMNLAVYGRLSSSDTFLRFYFNSSVTMTALSNWFSCASIWFVITVTVERLIAIKTPLKAHIFWNRRRLTIVIIAIWLLTLFLQLPQFFWFVVHVKPNCLDPTKSTFVLRAISPKQKNYAILKTLYSSLPLVIVIVPLGLLVSLNVLLIHFLRANNKNLTQLGMTNQNRVVTERKVTKRILCIILIYLIFNLPSAVLILWTIFETNVNVLKIILAQPTFVSTTLVTLSKGINFLLYCFVNANFRKQLKKLFHDTCDCMETISFGKLARNNNKSSKNCWKMLDGTWSTYHNPTDFDDVYCHVEKISSM